MDPEPDPEPHKFADDKPKCMEYEWILELFRGFEPFLEARIWISIGVWLSPDRMGPLDKPPASLENGVDVGTPLLPSSASIRTCSPTLLAPQCRYEAIRVWSYATFIVIEAMILRKLAVET
jgi:hypothetical protein